MKHPFAVLWTKAVRLFRHYPVRTTRAPVKPSRLFRLETLEGRLAPGEATAAHSLPSSA